jgi:hypothetical protein
MTEFKDGDWVYYKSGGTIHYGQVVNSKYIKWSCCSLRTDEISDYTVKKATIEEMVLMRISGKFTPLDQRKKYEN